MADKAISELIAAQKIFPGDLFVLEQDGTAKKLTGQVLENWLLAMADGHGGIHAIEKVSSNGLADTYRMTFADTSTFDFVVTNGRSIASVSKISTSGLVDTYQMSFNDGTSITYTVTNGEKGDTGDAWFVWIKYASQKPTDASHSIGDVPDNWIGIYSGTAPAAPDDWKQYQWFEYKGQKGDTGDPAVLVSSKVEYQVSTSGTVPPSGEWSENIPAIQQGSYLWTRTTKLFNSGAPVVDYTVGYIGRDGTVSFEELTEEQKDEIRGGVYTPEVTQPDASTMRMEFTPSQPGMPPVAPVDVTLQKGEDYVLTDSDRKEIATLAQKNLPTPAEPGDAASKQYADSRVVRNLLDNSDFRNPVNQRGSDYYSGQSMYTIDRWKVWNGSLAVSNEHRYVAILGDVYQLVDNLDKNTTYTFAVKSVFGLVCVSAKFDGNIVSDSIGDCVITLQTLDNIPEVVITNRSGSTYAVYWAALYEGEYTAETLPPYVPKGYAAELVECQRYYRNIVGWNAITNVGGMGAFAIIPHTFRVTPTIVHGTIRTFNTTDGWVAAALKHVEMNEHETRVYVNIDMSKFDAGLCYLVEGLEYLSADL